MEFGHNYDNERSLASGELVTADFCEAVSFNDAAGGGWGHDVVGDALDFHFGTGKEGVIAGDFEEDAVFHEERS